MRSRAAPVTDTRVVPPGSRRRCAAKARTRPARASASICSAASGWVPRASTSVTDPPPSAAHGARAWRARALGDAKARSTPNALKRSTRSKACRTPNRPRGGSAGRWAFRVVRAEARSTCAARRAAAEATIAGLGTGRGLGAASGTVAAGVGVAGARVAGAGSAGAPASADAEALSGAVSAGPGRRTRIVEVTRRPSLARATRSARRRRSPRRVSISEAASGLAHVVWSISVRGARAAGARRRAAAASAGRGVPTQ